MESRLPKPNASGVNVLKRPAAPSSMPAFRNLVPSDRMHQSHSTATTSNTAANNPAPATALSSSAPLAKMPLTATDFLNLPAAAIDPHAATRKRRFGSPDPQRLLLKQAPGIARAKLRRSRSANDLTSHRSAAHNGIAAARFVAGGGSSLDGMPPKLSKSTTSLRLHVGGAQKPKIPPPLQRPAQQPTVQLPKRPVSATVKRLAQPSAIAKANGARGAAASASSSSSSASTTATTSSTSTGPVAAKKFAPYDYKGRLLDLQERHKAMRERMDRAQEEIATYRTVQDQFEESQSQLFRSMSQLSAEQSQTQCLRQQLNTQDIKLNCLAASVQEKTAEVQRLRTDNERLNAENGQMRPELEALRELTEQLNQQLGECNGELTAAQESLFRSNAERRELHNVVMDLRGNIRVFCRVRPPLQSEEHRQLCSWQYADESTVEIGTWDGAGGKKAVRHEFSFDQVFHPRSGQADIFELVSPLIQSALDGYNVCIFAYGQTGSGKTFTMDGVEADMGVIPRTVDLLFDCIRNYRRLGWEYEIRVTFLEIYNESLYDLLSNEPKEMDIRMVSAKSPTDIYVSNITEVTANSADELRSLMSLARSNRATAATAGNERSSRSHAVTRIQLRGSHSAKSESCVGNINLVDLAGSESPKTSVRMEETKKINKSLSELTNVIMALMQRQEHIPYRNSKLTHLLMPSLGGNSKTLMFINVAPFQDCFVESVKSLRFAASVNQCKVAKAKRNKVLNTSGDQPKSLSGSLASLG